MQSHGHPRGRRAFSLATTILAAAALTAVAALAAGDVLRGPVPAQVVGVVDGDTIRVTAHIWLDQRLETLVRLAGVDAPELRGHCEEERFLAAEARDFLAGRIVGTDVSLAEVEYGKFAGRVVARVITADGEDLGESLLRAGLARPYDGGARASWCRDAAALTE